MGVAFSFPGSSYTDSGNINYRSTETLYFNEYWYEYETVDAGTTMTFSIQSTPGVVSFAMSPGAGRHTLEFNLYMKDESIARTERGLYVKKRPRIPHKIALSIP